MKTLIKNVQLPDEYGFGKELVSVCTDGKYISYVGREYKDKYDNIIDGKGNLLIPAFYNSHCHSAMILFKGYGENLPLDRWLDEKILPAEERLNEKNVYIASLFAISEMLKNGVVSFSDMYIFEESTARAVGETGIKANLSRCLVSFDKNAGIAEDVRFNEAKRLVERYDGAYDGRIKVDMSLHAEYTNVEKYIRETAEFAKENSLSFQIHASETEKEHIKCIERHNMTPIEFFESCGVFDSHTTLAHCVWATDNDIKILKAKDVCVSHNPKSNLKLGSGIMPLRKMLDFGVCVSLGTDGAASNNTLDIMDELRFASILHKGVNRNAEETISEKMLELATVNGAISQGRKNCGKIKEGFCADLVLINIDSVNNIPSYDTYSTLCYSADSSDVIFTMSDGKILYKDREYTTIDIEKLKYEFKETVRHYFD